VTGSAEDAALRVVLTTAPSAAVAEDLARALVDERLAACANIVPGVTSLFRWEGAVNRESEVLVLLKTTAAAVDRLSARLVELHPYDVPEVLAFGPVGGHEPYADWVRQEVGP
jgi:periplasmic divalent cation tolerance protein